jgi:Leucine-rich repeat (LRR) protein
LRVVVRDRLNFDVMAGDKLVNGFKLRELSDALCLVPGKGLLIGSRSALDLIDPATGKILRRYTGHVGAVLGIAPSPDDRYFVTGSLDQTIRLWSIDREEPLLNLFVVGREWIAWTPEGYYACSAYGEQLIAWQVNGGAAKLPTVSPAARFRPSMYQPAMLKYVIPAGSLPAAMAMAEQFDKALVQATSVADVLPPEVALVTPTKDDATVDRDTITVKATATAGGKHPVTAMRLLVDGRPFQGVGGVKRFDKPQATAEASWDVPLAPGPHSFAVIAESAVSKGMSRPAFVTRPGEPPKPNLYVLAIGVAAYRGDMKLRYAASDARRLAETFQSRSKAVFKDIEVRVLADADATKKGIREGMDWLKSKMTAKDVGVVAFSGHGARDPRNGRFYLVPVDVSEDDPEGTCLSGDEFKSRLENMPGRLVAILDACHSGTVAEKARPPVRADGLVRDLVAEDSGVVVMCASLGREYAIESRATKSGFFTLGLVEGMSGHGDVDQDGVIYIHELDLYASVRVSQLSGGRQNPTTGRPPTIRPFPIAAAPKLLVGPSAPFQADGAEDKAAAILGKYGGGVTRADKEPGKPVVGVRLSSRMFDECLRTLPAFENLRFLHLDGTPITDAGLKELATLTKLESLRLTGTPVTDAGLKELAPLKSLNNLELDRTQVAGRGLKELAGLTNLGYITLAGTKVTGEGLKGLAPLKNLIQLDLSGLALTDEGLKELAEVTSLQILDLRKARVTDAGVKELAPLSNLVTLYLSGTGLTDAGVKELAAFPKLVFLDLEGTKVTDAGVKELAALTTLNHLNLRNTNVTANGLKELQKAMPKCTIIR